MPEKHLSNGGNELEEVTHGKAKRERKDIIARPLTAKQRAFISWYISAEVNCNGTEAARRAGYRGNDNTLATVAFENLRFVGKSTSGWR